MISAVDRCSIGSGVDVGTVSVDQVSGTVSSRACHVEECMRGSMIETSQECQ